MRVLIMGLGLFGGGLGAVKFFARRGAEVIVTDLKPNKELAPSIRQLSGFKNITYHLGRHRRSDFKKADLIVVNPSVPADSPYLAIARQNNIPIETEMNLFFKLCPAKIIGITGSNGKTTTTALLSEMLHSAFRIPHPAFRRVWLGGNIGCGSLLERIGQIRAEDIVVLELSSFQLADLGRIKKSPDIAVALNIKPNHLDRHKTMANYINAKKNIIRYQTFDSFAVLNRDDKEIRKWVKDCPGRIIWFNRPGAAGFIKNNKFYFRDNLICHISDTPLLGEFNQENILAAVSVAGVLGVRPKIMAGVIKSFRGVEHRLEFVREINGVKYYNDSIATNPESTIGALRAISQTSGPGKIILIAGGYDKQLPFDHLAKEIVRQTKSVVLVGTTAAKIKRLLLKNKMPAKRILVAQSFPQAVRLSHRQAERGDLVLLSPACASYDLFNNFTERGKLFKKVVSDL